MGSKKWAGGSFGFFGIVVFGVVLAAGVGCKEGERHTCSENCLKCLEGGRGVCKLCKDGFFVEKSKCQNCGPNCKTCIAKDQCITCWSGYELNSKQDSCFSKKVQYLKKVFIIFLIILSFFVIVYSLTKLRHLSHQSAVNDIILGRKEEDNSEDLESELEVKNPQEYGEGEGREKEEEPEAEEKVGEGDIKDEEI